MKIEIHASYLQEMLKRAKGLELKTLKIENQKGLLITADNNITLIMNDLHTQLKSKIQSSVLEPGQVVILEPTLKLLENFKDDLITITDTEIKHSTKTIKYQSGDVDSFYKFKHESITNLFFDTTESELIHLLGVSYATAKPGGIRPMLEGINIRDSRFVATNNYYLSVRYGNFNTTENIVIPQNMWKTLLKTLSKKSDQLIKVFTNERLIRFVFTDYEVVGKLLDGEFSNINNVLRNDYSTTITLSPNELLKSLRLMKQLESPLILKLDNGLEIKSISGMNVVTDVIELESFEGQVLEIYFNVDYFYNVLNQFKDEIVEIGFTGENNPMFIRSEKKLELLLPVRK